MVKFVLSGAVLLLGVAPVLAGECGPDLQALAAKREAALAGINQMVAASKGKKLDPESFCARARPLNAAEEAMLAYMVKNKDWCQIPDDAVAQLKASHAKSVEFGGKACTVAAQIKKMKQQAAQAAQQAAPGGGGPPAAQPLPTGPL